MIIPQKCAICNGVLLNQFKPLGDIQYKSCTKVLGHSFECWCDSTTDEILVVKLTYKNINYKWYFEEKILYVENSKKKTITIPFFEPDLSDVPKLIKKIETYSVFS